MEEGCRREEEHPCPPALTTSPHCGAVVAIQHNTAERCENADVVEPFIRSNLCTLHAGDKSEEGEMHI